MKCPDEQEVGCTGNLIIVRKARVFENTEITDLLPQVQMEKSRGRIGYYCDACGDWPSGMETAPKSGLKGSDTETTHYLAGDVQPGSRIEVPERLQG